MEIKPIKTDRDYQKTLKEIEQLFDAKPNTPQGDRLDILATLVTAYEDQHFDLPPPDPIDAIVYAIESRGLSRGDLAPYIGSRARVSEILNRRRPLTITMVRQLHRALGIPAHILIQPYSCKEAA